MQQGLFFWLEITWVRPQRLAGNSNMKHIGWEPIGHELVYWGFSFQPANYLITWNIVGGGGSYKHPGWRYYRRRWDMILPSLSLSLSWRKEASKETGLCVNLRVSLAILASLPSFQGLWWHLGKNMREVFDKKLYDFLLFLFGVRVLVL